MPTASHRRVAQEFAVLLPDPHLRDVEKLIREAGECGGDKDFDSASRQSSQFNIQRGVCQSVVFVSFIASAAMCSLRDRCCCPLLVNGKIAALSR